MEQMWRGECLFGSGGNISFLYVPCTSLGKLDGRNKAVAKAVNLTARWDSESPVYRRSKGRSVPTTE